MRASELGTDTGRLVRIVATGEVGATTCSSVETVSGSEIGSEMGEVTDEPPEGDDALVFPGRLTGNEVGAVIGRVGTVTGRVMGSDVGTVRGSVTGSEGSVGGRRSNGNLTARPETAGVSETPIRARRRSQLAPLKVFAS